MADAFEEQYLLRVQDRALAARLNRVLAEDAAARPGDADIKLDFVGEGTLCKKCLSADLQAAKEDEHLRVRPQATHQTVLRLQRMGSQECSVWAARRFRRMC